MKVCDDIFKEGIDYVFVPGSGIYSTQESVSVLLNNIEEVLRLQSSNCGDHIKQIICNYYLSPCEINSFEVYSICPEDCNAVQMKCKEEWKIAQKLDYKFTNCNDTSALLFPLNSCCKRLLLQLQPSVTEGNKTIHIIFITVIIMPL